MPCCVSYQQKEKEGSNCTRSAGTAVEDVAVWGRTVEAFRTLDEKIKCSELNRVFCGSLKDKGCQNSADELGKLQKEVLRVPSKLYWDHVIF